MRIFYGKGAYSRKLGGLPELKLINLFVEQTPTNEESVCLQSRQGLVERASLGVPIRGVYREDGVFGGDTFSVAGVGVYREGTRIGTIAGPGPVSFAASGSELGVNAGNAIYRYDGATFSTVAFPDGANVRKLLYHDGQFVALREDTDTVYASDVLDLATWNALAFKSAESAPDKLLDAEFLFDALNLFGQATIEPWDNDDSGNTVPYTRRELSIFDTGVKAPGCVVKMDQALFFVSNESMAKVIRAGAPDRISDSGLEARIAASSAVSCFGYVKDGHSYFCIRLDDGTWCYDISTQQWHEGQTLGLPNWLVSCASRAGEEPVFGGTDGKLYEFGGWTDGAYPLERRFTAGIPVSGGSISVDVISIQANCGRADIGISPQVEMRASRDGGATWGDWRAVSLGEQGEYRTRVRWRRLGMFDEPGALIEFRTSDPVDFRVSGVFANEAGGGRSR